jgi:hypothetical protein
MLARSLSVVPDFVQTRTFPLAGQVLHTALNDLNRERLSPSGPDAAWRGQVARMAELSLLEGQFLEEERAAVAELARAAPQHPQRFAEWFDALREHGPGQNDPLFDFLAERASYEQVRWFLQQEAAGEAGFEDLVALTQLRLPVRAKLELARNYWDEMGRGKPVGMHGPMLTRLTAAFGLETIDERTIVWESLALGNLLAGLAYNRRFAYHSIGALGAVELTAPSRAVKVVAALDRLGVARDASHYFRLHSTVDVVHARDWRDEVLIPLLSERPELAPWLAEGALMRLRAGLRTFERYRREFARSLVPQQKRS